MLHDDRQAETQIPYWIYNTLQSELEGFIMLCPKCGKEMRKGYLFSSKDGAFSFANEVPGALENAKHAEGFVKLTGLKVGGRTSVPACCCDACRVVILQYGKEAEEL